MSDNLLHILEVGEEHTLCGLPKKTDNLFFTPRDAINTYAMTKCSECWGGK